MSFSITSGLGAKFALGLQGLNLLRGMSTDRKNLKLDQQRLILDERRHQQGRKDRLYYFDQSQDFSIQRRVADAKKAGLSGLAALGAPGAAMPAVNVSSVPHRAAGNNTGEAMEGMARLVASIMQSQDNMELLRMQHYERVMNANRADFSDLPESIVDFAGNTSSTRVRATPLVREPPARVAPLAESEPGSAVTVNGNRYEIPPGTPQRALEEEVGEWADWLPDNLHRFITLVQNQMRARLGIKPDRSEIYNRYVFAAINGQYKYIPVYLRETFALQAKARRFLRPKGPQRLPSIGADSP